MVNLAGSVYLDGETLRKALYFLVLNVRGDARS